MTDLQILTIAISIVIPVSLMIYSNSRITDVRTQISALQTEMRQSINDLEKHVDEKIDNGFEHMALLLKLHEAEHHKK